MCDVSIAGDILSIPFAWTLPRCDFRVVSEATEADSWDTRPRRTSSFQRWETARASTEGRDTHGI